MDAFLAALAEDGIELGADQAAAVRGVLSSGACVESLVGPAGTGKSFVTGVLAQAWQDPTLWDGQQRRVVGLATTEKATGVLEGEGLSARNIARWLAIQDRLAAGRPVGDDQEWRLGAGDLVMVDESSMVDTKALAAVHAHVTAAGAKWLLTGDHRQMTGDRRRRRHGTDRRRRARPMSWPRPAASPTNGNATPRCGCAPGTRPC